ncbi:MAG: VanW family protein [Oscillochloris sp.]|nr:VanW family protein [Oscillochloris sp.]
MRAMLLVGALILSIFPGRAAAATAPVLDRNGFIVDGIFLEFVQAHGGIERFGEPLSDRLTDKELGIPVQYFTNARLELHGTVVLPTRLGSILAAGREHEPPFSWLPADTIPAPGYVYVAASGHTLGGAFGWYHQHNGGTALLGHPISQEFVEITAAGEALLVQYFERTILSYREDEVRQAPLGSWLAERALTPAERMPGPALTALATVSIHYPPHTNDGHNIELAAATLDGVMIEPGGTFSFLGAIGPITAEAGYKPGTAIVGGEVVNNVVGGGICSVSTLLYRAAWMAGLPIVERQAHRYRLSAYDDLPGMDAAIYLPGLDLRIANNSEHRLYLSTHVTGGRASLTIWGRNDGRTVAVDPPVERNGGLEIHNVRRITAADGSVRRERTITSYETPPIPPEDADDGRQEPQARS